MKRTIRLLALLITTQLFAMCSSVVAFSYDSVLIADLGSLKGTKNKADSNKDDTGKDQSGSSVSASTSEFPSTSTNDSSAADMPYQEGTEAAKLFALGLRNMESGQFKKARDYFKTLAYKRPNDPLPSLKASYAADKAGDIDDALDWAKKACVISPKYPEAHLQLARLFEANQDWKAACLQYEVIYELEPRKHDHFNIEYPMLRSLIRAQEYEKAEQVSAEWTKEYKHSADAFFNRAWTLSQLPDQGNEQEKNQEAIRDYRIALKLDPKRYDARFNLALLLAQSKQNKAACVELEKFVQESPDDPDSDRAKSLLSKLRATE